MLADTELTDSWGRKPIRVLWVIKGLGPGGSERLLAAAAAAHHDELVSLTCAFVVAAKDHLVEELEQHGVRCICLSPSGRATWPLNLRQLIRRQRFDIVHVHSPLPGSIARLAVRTSPAAQRARLVTTEHNAQSTYRPAVRWLNSLTRRWDDASLAVSDEARSSLGRRAQTRTNVLVHGIDLGAARAQLQHRAAARAELGLADDDLVIGIVANFRRQKDFPNLLNAAAILRSRRADFKLVIVGQGPLETETRQLATSLGLDEVVTFTGFRPDATRLMSAFDIFTLSSKWEGLPVALMEATALGLAVVATSVGGVTQVFTHNQDALLVQPKDSTALANALHRCLTDASLRSRLAQESAKLADRFEIADAVTSIETLYSELVPYAARRTRPTAPPAKRRRASVEIRAALPQDRSAILEMLSEPLRWGTDPRSHALFAWKHDDNAFGASPIWVAVDGDRIVGVRAFMHWQFQRGGETLRVARAVDTATASDYRGRGLFTELTMHGVEALREQGIDFIFNTPNSSSLAGYLKMGWQEVGKLAVAAKVRPSRAHVTWAARGASDLWSLPSSLGIEAGAWLDGGGFDRVGGAPVASDVRALATQVSEQFLRWRYASPLITYRVVESNACTMIVRLRRRGRANELVLAHRFGDRRAADEQFARLVVAHNCDYGLRLGPPSLAAGMVPIPTGPTLTWRDVNGKGMPPLANWQLSLGDIELM